jgi:hypothetical protein
VKMLLNSGVDAQTNETIIPRTTFDLATSAISIALNKGSLLTSIVGYGLGWGRYSYRGHAHGRGVYAVVASVSVHATLSDGAGKTPASVVECCFCGMRAPQTKIVHLVLRSNMCFLGCVSQAPIASISRHPDILAWENYHDLD